MSHASTHDDTRRIGRRGYTRDVMATELQHRSPAVEDYLKAIYSLTAVGESASTNDLAARLGVSTGSVSAMVKRLAEEHLVEHAPYRGVDLTDEGRNVALRVLRRHRLIELFLARSLDMPWEDLHDEAEILEHAMSDELIELIAQKLGDPEFDPHGDPIPSRELTITQRATETLASLDPGEQGIFVRVSDTNSEMLRYLTEQGIAIGDRVEMVERQPFDGPCSVKIAGEPHALGLNLARAMRIQRV
ncbi:MAG: metal-dependent transcriptional regulator [Solirubrobacterales bacterium]